MNEADGARIAVLSANEDAPFVARLAADLTRSGYVVDDIASAVLHEDPSAEPGLLRQRLARAAAALVVLSPAAATSLQLRGEIEFAHLAGIADRIVPVIIAATEIPHSLRTISPVLFTAGGNDAALARLLIRLTTLGAQPTLQEATTAPDEVAASAPVTTAAHDEPLAPETYLPPRPDATLDATALAPASPSVAESNTEAPIEVPVATPPSQPAEPTTHAEVSEATPEPPPMGGFPAPITNKWAAVRAATPPKPTLPDAPVEASPAAPLDLPAPVAMPATEPAAPETPATARCQTCGARLRPGYARCGSCGMPVAAPAPTQTEAPIDAAEQAAAPLSDEPAETIAAEPYDEVPADDVVAQLAGDDLPIETERAANMLPQTEESRAAKGTDGIPVPSSAPERAPAMGALPPMPAPGASYAQPTSAPASAAAPAAESAGEEVAFSAYYPREVAPQTWERLLVYISLAATPILARVEADATERLAGKRDAFRAAMAPATSWLPRGTEVTLVPTLPGYTFNPPTLTVRWEEEAQAHEFRMRAETAQPGLAANGTVAIFTGPLLRGEVPISVFTKSGPGQGAGPTDHASAVARAYRRVFASYAHRDSVIVAACERTAEALGDRYLRDVRFLRSGEQWDERLLQAITEADIFQLFWSKAAAQSPAVEREWRHALVLQPKRGSYIRPVYWSEQPYPVPAELRALHFAYVPKDALGLARARRGLFGRLFRG